MCGPECFLSNICKECGVDISAKKKFCSNKGPGNCKDTWHNKNNPRGFGAAQRDPAITGFGLGSLYDNIYDFGDGLPEGWDGHKDL